MAQAMMNAHGDDLARPSQQPSLFPALSFLSLPSELRNAIYSLVLLEEDIVHPCRGYNPTPRVTTGLFRASRFIYQEARSLFYGRACFNMHADEPVEISAFLAKIGSTNASYITEVHIPFPSLTVSFERPDEAATLDKGMVSVLETFRSRCTNLRKLTMCMCKVSAMFYSIHTQVECERADAALRLIDAPLRAIPTLREIRCRLRSDGFSDHSAATMKGLGWSVEDLFGGTGSPPWDMDVWSDDDMNAEFEQHEDIEGFESDYSWDDYYDDDL